MLGSGVHGLLYAGDEIGMIDAMRARIVQQCGIHMVVHYGCRGLCVHQRVKARHMYIGGMQERDAWSGVHAINGGCYWGRFITNLLVSWMVK